MVPWIELERFYDLHLNLAPNSIRLCIGRLHIFDSWVHINKKVLCGDTVDLFFYTLKKDRHLTNASLTSYKVALNNYAKFLKHKKLDSSAFDSLPRFKKDKTLIIPLTGLEIMNLINCEVPYGLFRGKDLTKESHKLYTSMLVVLAFMGVRYGEIHQCKVKDINWSNFTVLFHGKGDSDYRREIPLFVRPYFLMMVEGKKPEQYVFESISGGPVCSQNFSFNVRKRAEICGITKPVNPHNFRHSYSTELLRHGAKIQEVARLLNHKDIQTTYQHYDHVQSEELQKVSYRHPLNRDSAPDELIFEFIKEDILSYGIEKHPNIVLEQGDDYIMVRKRVEELIK